MAHLHRESGDITHTTLAVMFLALLVASTFWVLSPFLTSILWATVISVATWPLLLRLQAAVGNRRGVAVATMTAAILLVVFIPVTLAVGTIVDNASDITADLRSLDSIALPALPSWVDGVPLVGKRIAASWNQFAALGPQERAAVLTPHIQTGLQWFAVKAGSVGTMLLQFLLATIVTAIVLVNGEMTRDALLRFAERLGGREGYDAALLAGQTIRAVVLGVVLTAVVQSAIAGSALWWTGIPAAGLLTAVILVLCLSQLGPLPVLVPAVAWLYWSGRTSGGTILLIAALISGALDNVVRPLLIKRGANIPLVLIFAGVIGGLIAFGMIGLFIGPVILSVAHTLLAHWVARAPVTAEAATEVPARSI